jgi:hypothetical protein
MNNNEGHSRFFNCAAICVGVLVKYAIIFTAIGAALAYLVSIKYRSFQEALFPEIIAWSLFIPSGIAMQVFSDLFYKEVTKKHEKSYAPRSFRIPPTFEFLPTMQSSVSANKIFYGYVYAICRLYWFFGMGHVVLILLLRITW